MAKGSEQFTWKKYPGVPRVCDACGRDLLVRDVGRIHSDVAPDGSFVTVFYCNEHRRAA